MQYCHPQISVMLCYPRSNTIYIINPEVEEHSFNKGTQTSVMVNERNFPISSSECTREQTGEEVIFEKNQSTT